VIHDVRAVLAHGHRPHRQGMTAPADAFAVDGKTLLARRAASCAIAGAAERCAIGTPTTRFGALNHGGGDDDDSKWSTEDPRSGGYASTKVKRAVTMLRRSVWSTRCLVGGSSRCDFAVPYASRWPHNH
jgi:hypothetical protein